LTSKVIINASVLTFNSLLKNVTAWESSKRDVQYTKWTKYEVEQWLFEKDFCLLFFPASLKYLRSEVYLRSYTKCPIFEKQHNVLLIEGSIIATR